MVDLFCFCCVFVLTLACEYVHTGSYVICLTRAQDRFQPSPISADKVFIVWNFARVRRGIALSQFSAPRRLKRKGRHEPVPRLRGHIGG